MPKKSKSLVCEHLEMVSGDVFEDFSSTISGYMRARQGVYALYKGDRLYYVGLTLDMKSRLKAHFRDRHQGNWDFFSVYLTKDHEHLKELEALVLRIAAPKGNSNKGKFSASINIKSKLAKDIRDIQKRIRIILLGANKKKQQATGVKITKIKLPKKGEPQLEPYISKRFTIKAEYKGYIYTAKVHKNGIIVYNGKEYTSPSLAGMAVNKRRTVNGWKFWKYRNENGEWVFIDELRKGRKATRKKPPKKIKAAKSDRKAALDPYVKERFKIRADYKGKTYWARVRQNGKINYNGVIYSSPSYAAKAVTGRPTSGPRFWKYKNKKGEWKPLLELMQP